MSKWINATPAAPGQILVTPAPAPAKFQPRSIYNHYPNPRQNGWDCDAPPISEKESRQKRNREPSLSGPASKEDEPESTTRHTSQMHKKKQAKATTKSLPAAKTAGKEAYAS